MIRFTGLSPAIARCFIVLGKTLSLPGILEDIIECCLDQIRNAWMLAQVAKDKPVLNVVKAGFVDENTGYSTRAFE